MIRTVSLRGSTIGLGLLLGLCLGLAVPAHAAGGQMGGFQGGQGMRSGQGTAHSGQGSFHGGRFHHGSGFHRRGCCVNGRFFYGFVPIYAAPYSYSAAPYSYPVSPYSYPAYPSPYPGYDSGMQMDVAPATPQEICYPNGCYRLQGDGVTTAYRWLWVPAPPPPPPPPPAGPPPESAPEPSSAPPPLQGVLYRWTDEQGVVHWTQGWDAVPARYRSQVKGGT